MTLSPIDSIILSILNTVTMKKTITKVSNYIKFPELEQGVTSFWKENNIFQKTLDNRLGQERYSFMDGPPFVSGSPHYASLLPSIAKDVIPRYQTMKGKYVRRVFGWDCHGLPIEEKISEKFNLKNSFEIEEFGVDRYIKECRSFVNETSDQWREYIEKCGRWVDLDNAYYTMNPEFNESVLWVFKQAWEKGLIYKGKRVSLFSLDNQTPVSEFEINMDPSNYKDTDDLAIYVKFPILIASNTDLVGANILIWTTTPWTIPAHMCIAFNTDIEYCLVEVSEIKYIIARSRILDVFSTTEDQVGEGKGKYVNILRTVSSDELASIKYEPVFGKDTLPQLSDKYFSLYPANYVTDTDGTGLVHIAGMYGKEDYDLCLEVGLSQEQILESITLDGKIAETLQYPADLVDSQVGVNMRKAIPVIADQIDALGKLFSSGKYRHRIPYFRGKMPLVYMAQDSYFISLEKIKSKMIELNQSINWYPAHLQNGRFLDVIKNAPDWCISRNRFWATIMPLWQSETGDQIVIGSIAEMSEYNSSIAKNENGVWEYNGEKIFLHRDHCDKIILTKNGAEYTRVKEVLDCWLDSGSVPFAEFGYPYKQGSEEEFAQSSPADFIVEYTGQLRAWFNILLRLSVIGFDKPAFKNAVVTGVLAGSDGRKMSKSFKNFPDPLETLNTTGGEALRLYLMGSSIMNGEDMAWSDEVLKDQTKNIIIPLWNTFTYFTIYAEMHKFLPSSDSFIGNNILDKWLESRINKFVNDITVAWDSYDMPAAVKCIQPTIDDVSTWYIRRSRARFASGSVEAMQNLYAAIVLITKAIAPQMPFISESIYQNIIVDILPNAKESVHLEDYPVVGQIDKVLLEDMIKLRELCSLGLSIRTEYSLAVRQPVATIETDLNNTELRDILKQELNAKEVLYSPKYIPKTHQIFAHKADEKIGFVAMNTELNKELITEGQIADLVRKIQNSRKNAGLQMGQTATLRIGTTSPDIEDFIIDNEEVICKAASLSACVIDGQLEDGAKDKFLGEVIFFAY